MRRAVLAMLAIVAVVALDASPASAATALPSSTQSCTDLLNPGTNAGGVTLIKTITGVSVSGGNTTITFTLTSSRTAADRAKIDRIRDCAFIDLDGDGVRDANEQVFSFDLRFSAGSFVNGAEYSVTIAGTGTICDRAAVSGGTSGSLFTPDTTFTDKSTGPDGTQTTCTGGGTEIPAGAIGGLGLAGLLGLLFVGYQVHTSRAARRRSAGALAL